MTGVQTCALPISGKLTYIGDADQEPGHVSIIAQSGGLSMDMLRRGRRLGVKYRAVVSVGNSADLGPAELIQWFLDDDDTQVVGLYLEDARRGRQLFDALQRARATKPVVLLVGGLTAEGARAAGSHTGALAGDARAWSALADQCGLVLTSDLDEFMRALLVLQTLVPRPEQPTRNVVLLDRKSTRLNSSHSQQSRMPSSA